LSPEDFLLLANLADSLEVKEVKKSHHCEKVRQRDINLRKDDSEHCITFVVLKYREVEDERVVYQVGRAV